MTRHPLTVTLGLIGLLGLACAKPVAPEIETASFTYTPTVTSGGQGISLAMVNPKASDRLSSSIAASGNPELPVGVASREAIGRSLLQYLTTAGFTVSGPFKSVDEMTFPEKKQADLILTVEFDFMPETPKLTRYNNGQYLADTFALSGNCTLGGTVTFVMWEPLSMQRMWSKSAVLPGDTVDCTTKQVQAEVFNSLLQNQLVGLYESGFVSTMKTAERYFNPEEVALVKQQSQELRDRKVY